MNDLVSQLKSHRLVPVVVIDSADDAVPLANALREGGLPVVEITFRTAAAEAAIRAISHEKSVLLGAGTVLNVDTAKRAIDAGASFIVTPGFGPKVVEFCLGRNIPIFPGAANATDLQLAVGEYQLKVVKFFPAEALGGLKTIKALAAPFPSVQFMPTGGITPENLSSYLSFPPVLACGGSWMVPPESITAKKFADIRRFVADSVQTVSRIAGGAAAKS